MDSFYPSDEEFFEGSNDNWIAYLHRIHWTHPQYPFQASEWRINTHDVELHDRIQDILYLNPDVDASKILVTVMNGHVHLTGEVRTAIEIKLAEAVVREISEVWSVDNELSVMQVHGLISH